jgi:uncharacterized protein YcbK (DUF882 family)
MGVRPLRRLVTLASFAGAFAAFGVFVAPLSASADVQHVVARGHTIEAIANRYRVTPKAILEANDLKDPRRIRPGDVLVIPKVDAPPAAKASKTKTDDKAKGMVLAAKVAKTPETYAARSKTPGIVKLRRIATTEEVSLRVKDGSGRVPTSTLKAIEKSFRSSGGLAHPIDARLIGLLGVVSNHFGGRTIEVVSGFRPYTTTQYNPHSNHNHGRAVDFRVPGVPNEVVRDFCRTLSNVGCGYYPNSIFVHMDVRDQSTFWIDYSRPGEPPRYNAPGTGADEGTSDVQSEDTDATDVFERPAAPVPIRVETPRDRSEPELSE